MSLTLRQIITSRAKEQCEYCRYPQSVSGGVLHLDHIISLKHGGSHRDENRALACQQCNLRKGDKIRGTDPQTGQIVRLFHPRLDDWNAHFHLNRQTGIIEPLTNVGRVTVQELGINEPERVAVRLRLISVHFI
jgi:5-methylcytosine-specific restriction endonuclease McrA